MAASSIAYLLIDSMLSSSQEVTLDHLHRLVTMTRERLLEQIKGKTPCLLNGDLRRHGKFARVGHDVDEHGTIMSQCLLDRGTNLHGVFDTDAHNPHGLSHLREVR